jgi:pimeloyl-ACP methyl ester carboxylesterase
VVVFDGPGQLGCMRTELEMIFRPDYEVPMATVLDAVVGLDGVDPARLALCGQSFGSYFAAHATATDPRVCALVANPPVVDMGRYMEAWVGTDVYRMVRDIRPEDLMPRQMQQGIEAICTRFGVPSFHAWRDAMESYRLGDLTEAISCPVLALVGEREGDEPRAQFDALVSGVAGPVNSRIFRPSDGASAHCQSDNLRLSAQVTFDWLDSQLA